MSAEGGVYREQVTEWEPMAVPPAPTTPTATDDGAHGEGL